MAESREVRYIEPLGNGLHMVEEVIPGNPPHLMPREPAELVNLWVHRRMKWLIWGGAGVAFLAGLFLGLAF